MAKNKETKILKTPKLITPKLKIAIVHDFLFQYGGAEKVVEKWLEMYPQAQVFTSFATPEKFLSSEIFTKTFQNNQIHTTFAQRIFEYRNNDNTRKFAKFQKHLFWLYPIAMNFVTLKDYDLVLVSSTDCAKQVHFERCHQIIHYCHSPTRYLHGLTTEADHNSLPFIYRFFIPIFKYFLRNLDLRAVKYLSRQKTIWVANSEFTQATIWNVYKTQSFVIYPPTETDTFLKTPRKIDQKDPFYLCHGRISFHKRLDLAIIACLQLGKKLKISGTAGFQKQMDDLKSIVDVYETENPNSKGLIEFLGRTTENQYIELLSSCQAFLFPGKEDSGIAPVEALAAGVPVIAFGAGGALEYIQDGTNGILFSEQSVPGMKLAIEQFESISAWNEQNIRATSQKFAAKNFEKQIKLLIINHFK